MSWIQTYTGKKFDFSRPYDNEICIEDIAHSLALQCRYMGHCKAFYSIAEHCCRVHDVLPPDYQKWGLLHDAVEAFTLDIPRPMKHLFRRMFPGSEKLMGFEEWEKMIEQAVFGAFGLHGAIPPDVKKADNLLLVTERRDLLGISPDVWEIDQCEDAAIDPLPAPIRPWSWQVAEMEFLARYHALAEKEARVSLTAAPVIRSGDRLQKSLRLYCN